MALYMRERRQKRRERIIKMLGDTCHCGSTDRLEIDHKDWSQKAFTLSGKDLDQAWNKIVVEVEKCQLLCHEHHRAKTIAEGRTGGGHNRIEDPKHGTWVMYTREKCKCEICKQWRRDYRVGKVDAHNILRWPNG